MDNVNSFSSGKRKSGSFRKKSHSQFDNGKRKRMTFNQDLGSATPKVIDTLYRILCPVKKIGSVLGRGGEIINALRDETHAKIRVADAIPGAEERVIIIFNYPKKQPTKADSDQDLENDDFAENEDADLRPHCTAQDALLKIHERIAADEYLHGGVVHEKTDGDDAVTARILVPSNQVGCLIGKGGTIIQKLRTDTSANIRILPAEHLPPCAMSSDELVQISGTPAIVKKALYDISTLLHQHPRKENPPLEDLIYVSTQGLHGAGASMPPPDGNPLWSHQHPGARPTPMPWFDGYRNEPSGYGYNGSRFGDDGEAAEEFSMRILCATGRIGGVIGKGGANVRQLEQQTRARIQVEDTSPEAAERVIHISSKEAPWDPISPTIEAVLQLQNRTSATSEDGVITTRLLVPSSKVGCLLGQGGNIITEMRRRTRADIRVYAKEDKPDYTSATEELVQISGNPNVTTEALLEIASRLRTRTFRGGNSAGKPGPVPVHGFAPSESMPGRRLTPPAMIGAAGNHVPVYPVHEFAPPETVSSRVHSSGIVGAGSTVGYEYPKGPGPAYEAYSSSRGPTGATYEAQSYPRGPTGATYEAQSYPRGPTGAAYETQSYHRGPTGAAYETQSYPCGLTGATYESQGYPRGPTGATYEAQIYPRGPTGGTYEAQGYSHAPAPASGYPNINSSIEVKIPNSAVASVLGAGGSNISDIRQISGARVMLHDPIAGASECVVEIQGTSEQVKAAQSLLQAFVASGGQSAPPSSLQAPPPRLY